MNMIMGALLILLLFLTLFAIALWPVLFKNSPHKKIIFIGSNIIMIIMVLAFASAAYQSRRDIEKRNDRMRTALKQAASGLRSGKAPAKPFTVIEVDDSKREMDFDEQLTQFQKEAEAYSAQSQEVQK